MPIAIDFETFYSTEYSVRNMNTWQYVFDPRFDAYMVSLYGPGLEWVGEPRDFDWSKLAGQELLAHNASFDGLIVRRLQQDGLVPQYVRDAVTHDTSDLAAFLGSSRRSLDFVAKEFLGVAVSKGMRDWMRGKTLAQARQQGRYDELAAYCLQDSRITWQFFDRYGAEWPADERRLSRENRESCWKGCAVDRDGVDAAVQHLRSQLDLALGKLPWVHEDGAKPLSMPSAATTGPKRRHPSACVARQAARRGSGMGAGVWREVPLGPGGP